MYAFIFLVILTAYLPLSINVGSLNIRASQMFLPIVLVMLMMETRNQAPQRREVKLAIAGFILWFAFLFWTIANTYTSISQVTALGHVGLLGLNLIHALCAYLLLVKIGDAARAVSVFMGSVTAFNIFVVLLSVANAFGIISGGAFIVTEDTPVLIDGELGGDDVDRFVLGVLTGNLSAATMVMAVALLLDQRRRARWQLWGVIFVSTLGLIVGFSRQGTLSALAGLMLLGLFLVRKGRVRRIFILSAAVASILILIYSVSDVPVIRDYFRAFAGRTALLVDIDSYQYGTTRDRLQMWSGMMEDFVENPFIGAGQDTYLKYYPSQGGGGSHSFPVEILHATGLSGILPYLYLHIVVFWRAWKLLVRKDAPESTTWLLAAVTAGFASVVLASFTNLIFWGPQYWLLLGITVGTIRILRAQHNIQAPVIRHSYAVAPATFDVKSATHG
jgi:hypothetical protein